MSVPMLPAHMINNAFTELLSENIVFEENVDHANFCRFKWYVNSQWQQKVRSENLSVHGSDNCTNNGCECCHSILKNQLGY